MYQAYEDFSEGSQVLSRLVLNKSQSKSKAADVAVSDQKELPLCLRVLEEAAQVGNIYPC